MKRNIIYILSGVVLLTLIFWILKKRKTTEQTEQNKTFSLAQLFDLYSKDEQSATNDTTGADDTLN